MNYFSFNGRSSADFGITIEESPNYCAPKRVYDKVTVPGRSGSLLIDTGAYSNYTQEYEVSFSSSARGDIHRKARDIAAWLGAATDYGVLSDSYDKETYRYAVCLDGQELTTQLLRYGYGTVSFECKPQRYLKYGDTRLNMTNGGVLHNPTLFDAKPLLFVVTTANGSLSIGERVIEFHSIGSYTLDCEAQNAYDGDTNRNGDIFAPDFPVLHPGGNNVTWSGGVRSVMCEPRWWTI